MKPLPEISEEIKKRLLAKIFIDNGCWIWTGTMTQLNQPTIVINFREYAVPYAVHN